jgi:hypothetical protein
MERQVVEARLVSHHLCEQLPVEVEDAQDAVLDVDVAAHLIQFPKTNDAGLEPWDEVDTREGAVPAVLAREDDRPSPFNHRDGSITKADSAADLRVELDEDLS